MMLRNFSPTDLGEVMQMVAGIFSQDYSPSFYLSLHSYWPDGFIVATEDGKIVGIALGSITGEFETRMLMLAVDERHRKRGTGAALLIEFHNRCSLKGIRKIVLEVRALNASAHKFYLMHGYQYSGRLPKYYLDGEDGIIMTKWL
jgi:ribosomal protein S18 acetylase RimI-like enzyme